jgi:hypothetical protein
MNRAKNILQVFADFDLRAQAILFSEITRSKLNTINKKAKRYTGSASYVKTNLSNKSVLVSDIMMRGMCCCCMC